MEFQKEYINKIQKLRNKLLEFLLMIISIILRILLYKTIKTFLALLPTVLILH